MTQAALLSVENLKKYFLIRGGLLLKTKGHIKAVDGVNFDVFPHETYGIVGESGCGKTTLARMILRLIEPTSGKIHFEGEDITVLQGKKLKSLGKSAQIVFQNPFSALHPRMMIKDIVGEPLKVHFSMPNEEVFQTAAETLKAVGLSEEHMYRYPHEFSGGQRQRIVIARAIVLKPRLVVLDEPTAALDVSVQAKILNLLIELQGKHELTYVLISHNLSLIDYMCDRIMVMYLGRLVEEASKKELFNNPLHPYSQALISSIPVADLERKSEPIILKGEVPSPMNPPSGCHFRTRCPHARPECGEKNVALEEVSAGHRVACHFWREIK